LGRAQPGTSGGYPAASVGRPCPRDAPIRRTPPMLTEATAPHLDLLLAGGTVVLSHPA
jgi:hypothetical protein